MFILHYTEKEGEREYIVLFDEDKAPDAEVIDEWARPGFALYGKPIEAEIYASHALPTGSELEKR